MLEKYNIDQKIVTNLLLNSISNNKLSQAYLFVCDDVEYIYKYAKEFVKEIIKTSNLKSNILDNIYKRIDKNEYTELKLVEPDGQFIKKEQLMDLQNSVLTKPVEANKIVYIIKNCEKLNSSSANSILKFLEEPSDDVIAILLTDNLNMVIPTIKSRCQVLNFNSVRNNINENIRLKKYILPDFVEKEDEEYENLIISSIEFIKNVENKKITTVIFSKSLLCDKFKTIEDINIFLNFLIYSYMDSLYKKMGNDIKYLLSYIEIVDLIVEKNDINDIITKINIIEQTKLYLKSNVNSKLLFDKLIIEFSEV